MRRKNQVKLQNHSQLFSCSHFARPAAPPYECLVDETYNWLGGGDADIPPQALCCCTVSLVVMRPPRVKMNLWTGVLHYEGASSLIYQCCLPDVVFIMTITTSSLLNSVQSAVNQWETFLTACLSTLAKSTVRAATPELLIDHSSCASTPPPPASEQGGRSGTFGLRRSKWHITVQLYHYFIVTFVKFRCLSDLWIKSAL